VTPPAVCGAVCTRPAAKTPPCTLLLSLIELTKYILCKITMKSCTHRGQRMHSLLHSCPVRCTELGLQGLASLATTSSGLRNTCQSILNSCPASWLASSLGIDNKARRLQAVAWVLRAAPAGAANAAQVLLSVQEVPLDSAKQLVSAGFRVSYAQLLAAAHSMVAGVEVWVQAQRELGVPSDIPAAAEAICCSAVLDIYVNWVSQVLLLAGHLKCAVKCTMVHAMQCMVHGVRACADTAAHSSQHRKHDTA
jgi:hypothetical protein